MITTAFDEIQTASGIKIPYTNLGEILTAILPYIFGIAGIILLLNIIVAGYKIMTSAGEPKVMQAAQSKITSSLIGIVIMFVSFWVIGIIGSFFGIEIFKKILGTSPDIFLWRGRR